MEIRLYDSYYVYRTGTDIWPPEEKPVSLSGAKNGEAFCSLLILPDQRDNHATVSVGENPAFSRYGLYENYRVSAVCSVPEVKVSCKLIDMVPDDAGIYTADIILEQDYIEMKDRIGQQVMVLCEVPENVQAGAYTVTVQVCRSIGFAPEEVVKTYEIPLTVYDYAMPSPAEYKFHLDLWQHNSNIARKHDVSLYSDAHFAVIESYVKSLAALGQKAVTVIASEIPWSGQRGFYVNNYPSDLYEYNMIKVRRKGGEFIYDYSAMQRYIDLCFANGIDREIEVFGLINIWSDERFGFGKAASDDPDAVRIRYYDEDAGIYRYMDTNEQICGYVTALEQYFLATNQMQYVQVVADEPGDIDIYRVSLERLQKAAPAFAYKVAINHIEFIDEFGGCISDIVPALNFAAKKASYLTERAKTAKGRTLLYVCCGPDYPNTFLHSQAYEIEVLTMLIHKMGIDGFLRWNYTVWPDHPRERLSFRAPGWKAGDTNFVYPGYNGKALLSLRWHFLKRAVLDFELLVRAAEACPEVVKQVYAKVFVSEDPGAFASTSYGAEGRKLPQELYAQDSNVYQQVQDVLLEALSKA